jgi:Tfp pilus assembly protein PilX
MITFRRNRKIRNRRTNHRQRGVALIAALLTLVLIAAITAGMIILSTTETNISANFRDEQTAFFAAKAGIEEVRDRLRKGAPNTLAANLPTTLPGTASGVLYITNPAAGETVAPWNTSGTNYPDDEICNEVTCVSGVPAGSPWYTTTSASASYAATPQLPWKWVRVTLKTNKCATSTLATSVDGSASGAQVCWNTTTSNETTTSCATNQPVYELTALAVTPSGSRRMEQFEAIPIKLLLSFPGAVTTTGTYTGAIAFGNQNAGFGISGVDQCGVASPKYAVSGTNATSVTNLTGQLTPAANYPGSGATPSVGVASLTNFTDPITGNTLDLTTIAGINQLVADVTSVADHVDADCSNTADLGSPTSPTVVVVTGDCNISSNPSPQYAGILLVEGTLNYVDNPYQGTILCIGKGIFHQQASKLTHMDGQIFLAQTISTSCATTPYLSTCAPLATPGSPELDWHAGSGNPNLQYNSCNVLSDSPTNQYRVIATREVIK